MTTRLTAGEAAVLRAAKAWHADRRRMLSQIASLEAEDRLARAVELLKSERAKHNVKQAYKPKRKP